MISNLDDSSGGNGVPVKDPSPGAVGCDLHEIPAAQPFLSVPVLADSPSGATTVGEARESTDGKTGCQSSQHTDSRGGQKTLRETFMREGAQEIGIPVQATEARSVDSGANSGRATNRKKKPNRGRNPRFVVQETTGISDRNLELPISAAEMDMAYRNFWIRRGFCDREIPSASTWYLAPEPQEGPILTNYFGKDV